MAMKLFESSIVDNPNPGILGFALMKNFRSFSHFFSNPNKITGPLKVLASKIKETDRKKARGLLDLGDKLERAMNSAKKDFDGLGWVRTGSFNTAGAFSAAVSRHAKYNDLVSFHRKVQEIRKLLVSVRGEVLKSG